MLAFAVVVFGAAHGCMRVSSACGPLCRFAVGAWTNLRPLVVAAMCEPPCGTALAVHVEPCRACTCRSPGLWHSTQDCGLYPWVFLIFEGCHPHMRLAVLCGLCTPKLRVCLCTLTSVVPIDCLPPRMLLQSAGLLVWLQIVLLCLLLSLRATRVGVQGFETRLVAFQHLLRQSGLNRFFLVFGLFGNCMQAFCGCFLGVTTVIVCVQASWYGDVLCSC